MSLEVKSLSDLKEGLLVVKFWAPWCGSCSQLAPNLEKSAKLSIYELTSCNVDDNQDISVKFNIRSLPTTVLLKDGVEIDRMVGNQEVAVIKKFLNV